MKLKKEKKKKTKVCRIKEGVVEVIGQRDEEVLGRVFSWRRPFGRDEVVTTRRTPREK